MTSGKSNLTRGRIAGSLIRQAATLALLSDTRFIGHT